MLASDGFDHTSALVISEADQNQIRASSSFWQDKTAKITVDQVHSGSLGLRFEPLMEETMFHLKSKERLWIRLDVERLPNGRSEDWSVWIPLPLIDSVTLYQQDPTSKRWLAQSAGDRIAVNSWPEPGRYPRFHLELPTGKSTLYLQIQGSTPVSVPLHLGTEIQAQKIDRQGFWSMGLVVGVLLTLVLVCLVTAYTYHDRLYLMYSAYVAIMILAVCAYTGMAAYLFWDDSPLWADASQGSLAILTAGGAMYFIESLLGGRHSAGLASRILPALGLAALPVALAYVFMQRDNGVILLGAYMLLALAVGMYVAVHAWQRGDRVGLWVFLSFLPLGAAVLVAIARAYGWVTISWWVQYGVVASLIVEVPMMMVALNMRSRERHEMRMREQTLSTQDALTGLLSEPIFDDRLKQTALRFARRREDATVMLISLVNYEQIAMAYGSQVAEHSVLRAVIKLRKVLLDVDTVARVQSSYFGVILEGSHHRSLITELGARLIAQGLMPLPGLIPEVTLQFHLASLIMRESASVDQDIKGDLMDLLQGMSGRTRRPIRFLEHAATVLASSEPAYGAAAHTTPKPPPVKSPVLHAAIFGIDKASERSVTGIKPTNWADSDSDATHPPTIQEARSND